LKKKTPEMGILIKSNNSNELRGYTDSDWAKIFDRKRRARNKIS
jgi:hypothetical protein